MTEERKKNHWYEMYELECLKTKELEKENAELKCECRRCVYTDCPCILSDYGKDKTGICDHFKDVFEELKNWKIHTLYLQKQSNS